MSFSDRDFAKNNVLAKARQVFLLTRPPISLPFDECALIVKNFASDFNIAGLVDSVLHLDGVNFRKFYGKLPIEVANSTIENCLMIHNNKLNEDHEIEELIDVCNFVMRNIGFLPTVEWLNLFYLFAAYLMFQVDFDTYIAVEESFREIFQGKSYLIESMRTAQLECCALFSDPEDIAEMHNRWDSLIEEIRVRA